MTKHLWDKTLVILASSAVLLSFPDASSAAVEFRAEIDKLRGAYEDRFEVTIVVEVSSPDIQTTPILPPNLLTMKVGATSSSVERRGDTIIRRYSYALHPQKGGNILIPPFRLAYTDGDLTDTLSSESFFIEVAQPVPKKTDEGSGWYYLILGLVVFAGAVGFYLMRLRRRRKQSPDTDAVAAYNESLAGLRRMAERENYADFAAGARRLVVTLLERKYGVRLAGHTSSDLQRWAEEHGLEKELRQLIADLCEFCDGIKFSSSQIDRRRGTAAAESAAKIVERLLQ